MTDAITSDADRYTGLLEPDTLLASQFFGALRRKPGMDGQRRLMLAVLEDAVNCFRKQIHAVEPKARQLFRDAEQWITSTDQTWFCSFVNVCDTLDLNPDWVRQGLLKWRDAQLRASRAQPQAGPRPTGVDDEAPQGGANDAEAPLRRASGG
jgi:hypothetical protein